MEPRRQGRTMRNVPTTIRCVPRYGYEFAEVRTIDLDMPEGWEDHDLRVVLTHWFDARGIVHAVYDIDVDDDGFFAIVNDEAYQASWGEPLL